MVMVHLLLLLYIDSMQIFCFIVSCCVYKKILFEMNINLTYLFFFQSTTKRNVSGSPSTKGKSKDKNTSKRRSSKRVNHV